MLLNQRFNCCFLRILNRIDVRDRVKCLQKDPREESRLEIDRLRQSLTTDLIRLESLKSTFNHPQLPETDEVDDPHAESFDNLDGEIGEADQSGPDEFIDRNEPDNDAVPPERRPLYLPSSHSTRSDHPLRQAELNLRIKQATRYLAAVREAVAEKSFQYSHVMRSAPSVGVRTRSRTVIKRVSDRIAHYSRVYCRARAALVRLGADERLLRTFQLLSRDDVKASTAIRDPNSHGSSTLRLSWIWETGTGTSGSADAMRECKPCRLTRDLTTDYPQVQRVHWVRARAQKNRWQEELLLVKYEMQWTTRSFLHKAREWQARFEEPNIDRGPQAYAARQSAQWRYMALDADRLFRSANSEYTSLIA
jgi:hypothetical protein